MIASDADAVMPPGRAWLLAPADSATVTHGLTFLSYHHGISCPLDRDNRVNRRLTRY
jgi:hypothetical protein